MWQASALRKWTLSTMQKPGDSMKTQIQLFWESHNRLARRNEAFMDAVREGMKRAEIAAMLDIQPRQLDKVREKLFRRVKAHQSSLK